jgi:hypothetical protein
MNIGSRPPCSQHACQTEAAKDLHPTIRFYKGISMEQGAVLSQGWGEATGEISILGEEAAKSKSNSYS